MSLIEITMLGGFQITVDGKPVLTQLSQSRKATALVQYLLLENGRKVPHKELTDALWASESTTNPDMALRAILHRFRNMVEEEGVRALQDCIITTRGSYQWNSSLNCDVDVHQVQLLSEELRVETDPGQREMLCADLVELYKGRLLPGSASETWVERRSIQLHSRYQSALYEALDACKQRGEWERANKLYNRALELDPFDEQLYLGRILVLQHLGRADDARALVEQGAERGCLSEASRLRASDSLFRQLEQADKHSRADIQAVGAEMDCEMFPQGAYLCSYEVFSGIYQVLRRIEARHGFTSFMALITLIPQEEVSEKELRSAMHTLRRVICRTLRSCDVVAEYSSTQYLVLLCGSGEGCASKPMERIKTAFYAEDLPGGFLIGYNLHAPEVHRSSPASRRR